MKARILYVEDDIINSSIVEDLMTSEGYQCTILRSGQECLDQAAKIKPDLILMDVLMPDLNGLETCTRLRHIDSFHNIPIIFISARNELEDRLKGYNAGGDDYIGKPFEPDELVAKIESSIERRNSLNALYKKVKESALTTNNLMTALGEIGLVMHFLQASSKIKNIEILAQKIIQTHASMSLEISIEIRIYDQKLHFCTEGISHPLEESVFNYVISKGRLVDFNNRTAVNFPEITILVRNMPLNDPEKYGRIKDYIAIIAEGANAKINSLKSDQLIHRQYKNMLSIIDETKETIKTVDNHYRMQQYKSNEILSEVSEKIESSFLYLGLSDEQETQLQSITKKSEEKMTQLFQETSCIDEKLNHILSQMEHAIASFSVPKNEPIEEENNLENITLF